MLSWSGVEVLTFDCYGTLIDWETGILKALRSVVSRHGVGVSDEDLLAMFGAVESPIQHGPFQSYRAVLDQSLSTLCSQLGFEPTTEEATALSRSLSSWQPFPDTNAALIRLAARFKLGIISNVDDDLFAGTARHLPNVFSWVVTAQQAGAYKPSLSTFRHAHRTIGAGPNHMVHCAQSLFHDIGPAQSLGVKTVWINRRAGKAGSGATPPSTARADLEFPSLAALADSIP